MSPPAPPAQPAPVAEEAPLFRLVRPASPAHLLLACLVLLPLLALVGAALLAPGATHIRLERGADLLVRFTRSELAALPFLAEPGLVALGAAVAAVLGWAGLVSLVWGRLARRGTFEVWPDALCFTWPRLAAVFTGVRRTVVPGSDLRGYVVEPAGFRLQRQPAPSPPDPSGWLPVPEAEQAAAVRALEAMLHPDRAPLRAAAGPVEGRLGPALVFALVWVAWLAAVISAQLLLGLAGSAPVALSGLPGVILTGRFLSQQGRTLAGERLLGLGGRLLGYERVASAWAGQGWLAVETRGERLLAAIGSGPERAALLAILRARLGPRLHEPADGALPAWAHARLSRGRAVAMWTSWVGACALGLVGLPLAVHDAVTWVDHNGEELRLVVRRWDDSPRLVYLGRSDLRPGLGRGARRTEVVWPWSTLRGMGEPGAVEVDLGRLEVRSGHGASRFPAQANVLQLDPRGALRTSRGELMVLEQVLQESLGRLAAGRFSRVSETVLPSVPALLRHLFQARGGGSGTADPLLLGAAEGRTTRACQRVWDGEGWLLWTVEEGAVRGVAYVDSGSYQLVALGEPCGCVLEWVVLRAVCLRAGPLPPADELFMLGAELESGGDLETLAPGLAADLWLPPWLPPG